MLRFPQFVQNRSEEYIRDATRAAIIMGAVYGVLFVLMLGKCWLNWRNTQVS